MNKVKQQVKNMPYVDILVMLRDNVWKLSFPLYKIKTMKSISFVLLEEVTALKYSQRKSNDKFKLLISVEK